MILGIKAQDGDVPGLLPCGGELVAPKTEESFRRIK
jgi:hypothetical protein